VSKRKQIAAGICLLLLAAAGYGVYSWRTAPQNPRQEILKLLPTDATAVMYIDFARLRNEPFVKELYAWAPQPEEDADYEKFVGGTGFRYESDLDRVGIAMTGEGEARRFFAIADGRFDQRKIEDYALRGGRKERQSGKDVYYVPAGGGNSIISFFFLTKDRIALTNEGSAEEKLEAARKSERRGDWNERFERLAGAPMFVLIRQEGSTGQVLAEQAPAGLRSPQLATLLTQLQWISIAGKPAGERLQIVSEGETASEETVRQLSEFLQGALLLAETGLSDPKVGKQVGEDAQKAYLDLLKSAEIEKVDRGETKSVRMVLDVTPSLLKVRSSPADKPEPAAKPQTTSKNVPSKGAGTPNSEKPAGPK
jgi:hypothetical protein